MRPTFHLVRSIDWAAADPARPWAPPSLAAEGFIHCTDGLAAMVDTANRFYAAEPGEFLLLTVDLDAVGAPWRFDEPGRPYPHVYGPMPRAAILDVGPMPRTAAGRFEAPRD
ncbi:MAG TPA: DUF952 domain-containing protein [Candidatus Sulfotelmatobacter sp.]|nr:DUF952 domain-containing protein [Candidatus Sulfotelmatobacter sp.]